MLRLLAKIAVILWIVVGVTELVSLAPPAATTPPKINENSSAKNNSNDDANARPISFILGNIGTSIHSYRDDITAVSTALLAIITAALVLIARNQYKTTRAQLRAYLFVSGVFVTNLTTVPKFIVSFKNCGQTPAYKITFRNIVVVESYPLLIEPIPGGDLNQVGYVGPLMEFHSTHTPEPAITTEQIASVVNRQRAFFYYGIVTYTDAFKKTWSLKFCFTRGGPNDAQSDGQMNFYKDWNEAT